MRSARPPVAGIAGARDQTALMRLRRYLALLTLLVIPCVSAGARAQVSATSSSSSSGGSTGGGIRLGDAMVLHLGLGTEVGWDSNVFFEANNATNAFYLRLNPSFDLTNRPRQGTRAFQLDFHGGLGYVEYLSNRGATGDHRQFNVDAGVLASFFATGPYNFSVFANYVRTTMPPYTASSQNFDRDTNDVGARINLSPGGGRLTINIGYLFGIDYFENGQLTDFDLQSHRFDLRVSWRFLPKTALYVAAFEVLNFYQHRGVDNHPDSFPLHVEAGIQGLITAKLTVNAWIGYANGFYQWPATTPASVGTPNPNTAIGGLSLSWKPTMLSTGAIGYQHDFVNSLLGAYYDEDMVYLSWSQLVWRFTGFIRAQYANMRFQGVQPVQATSNGTDNNFMLNIRVDYPFRDWLIGSVGYDLFVNRSNRMLLGPGGTMPGAVPVDYTKNVVYLRLSFQY
jgi:hypothetical protein